MRYRFALPFLVASLLIWPATASAHWSFTRWDMTVDQVLAAGKGKLVTAPGGPILGQTQQVSGLVDFEGRKYTADFFFSDKGGLTLVRLKPFGTGDCQAIIDEMKARHGPSANAYNGDWKDKKTGDRILQSFSFAYTPCYTSYAKPGI